MSLEAGTAMIFIFRNRMSHALEVNPPVLAVTDHEMRCWLLLSVLILALYDTLYSVLGSGAWPGLLHRNSCTRAHLARIDLISAADPVSLSGESVCDSN